MSKELPGRQRNSLRQHDDETWYWLEDEIDEFGQIIPPDDYIIRDLTGARVLRFGSSALQAEVRALKKVLPSATSSELEEFIKNSYADERYG